MSPGFPKAPVHPKWRGSWGAPFRHPRPRVGMVEGFLWPGGVGRREEGGPFVHLG